MLITLLHFVLVSKQSLPAGPNNLRVQMRILPRSLAAIKGALVSGGASAIVDYVSNVKKLKIFVFARINVSEF